MALSLMMLSMWRGLSSLLLGRKKKKDFLISPWATRELYKADTCLGCLSEAWLLCLAVGGHAWMQGAASLSRRCSHESLCNQRMCYLPNPGQGTKATQMPCYPGSNDLICSQINFSRFWKILCENSYKGKVINHVYTYCICASNISLQR